MNDPRPRRAVERPTVLPNVHAAASNIMRRLVDRPDMWHDDFVIAFSAGAPTATVEVALKALVHVGAIRITKRGKHRYVALTTLGRAHWNADLLSLAPEPTPHPEDPSDDNP
jgi:hypothetical protein